MKKPAASKIVKKKPIANSKSCVIQTAQATLPTLEGNFDLRVYKSALDGREHVALIMRTSDPHPKLVRIHSQCLTGDALQSIKCDCREQLHESMRYISEQGAGILLYLQQEGRDIGLTNKIKAYALQEHGLDTVEANVALGLPADGRDYKIAADMLKDLGATRIMLMTNNPDKIDQLTKYGIKVIRRVPLEVDATTATRKYLTTKKEKMNHQLFSV